MADPSYHLAQVRHNLSLYDDTDVDQYPDFAVVVVFYAAVHYVDAVIARETGLDNILSHDMRRARLERLACFDYEFRDSYYELQDRSVTARYKDWRGEIDASVAGSLRENEFAAIEECARELLGLAE